MTIPRKFILKNIFINLLYPVKYEDIYSSIKKNKLHKNLLQISYKYLIKYKSTYIACSQYLIGKYLK
jgi:hypothetical protein